MLSPLLVGLVAFLVSYVLVWWLASPHAKLRVLDISSDRSLHATPTPKTGGIAVVAGLTCALLFSHSTETIFLAGALTLAGLSFWNDLRGLSPWVRLSVHILVAAVFVVRTDSAVRLFEIPVIGGLSLGVFSIPLTVIAIVWMTNLYNFMDGMDGFSGGMTVAGFACFAVAATVTGNSTIAVISIAVACAAAGFLMHNFPPAKIFLGDVGSISVGFMAAALGAIGVRDRAFDVWVPVLAFSPFVVDATITLLRRLSKWERVWEPHRKHFYQRLVLVGWNVRRVVLCEYLVMAACLLSVALYMLAGEGTRLAILGAWTLAYLLLGIKCNAAVASREKTQGSQNSIERARIQALKRMSLGFASAFQYPQRIFVNAIMASVSTHCGLLPNLRLIDAPCGNGETSDRLATLAGVRVWGYDVSTECIAAARRNFSRDNLSFHHADIHELFSQPQDCDVVCIVNSLFFLRTADLAAALGRSLRRGAILFVIIPNLDSDNYRMFKAAQTVVNWTECTPDAAKEIFSLSGFSSIEEVGLAYGRAYGPSGVRFTTRLAAPYLHFSSWFRSLLRIGTPSYFMVVFQKTGD